MLSLSKCVEVLGHIRAKSGSTKLPISIKMVGLRVITVLLNGHIAGIL